MNKIIKILMNRDGMTKDEAVSYYKESMQEVMDDIYNGGNGEDLFMDLFGLEPDYLLNVII